MLNEMFHSNNGDSIPSDDYFPLYPNQPAVSDDQHQQQNAYYQDDYISQSYSLNYARQSNIDQECSRNRAYITLIVSILPLWMILTTLIVFVLLSFHKNLKATRVYDECTKLTAQYTYFIELRTGDTTSSFNRRKTTLTIDLFDDNQNTLARIAVPSHVIFGRRDTPIGVIDDDKYSELRVTRLWLYRATRLKRATTIRITHSCIEPDARVMVYGVEVRSNDRDRNRLFFPIMSYISAYGATNKPNTCFDIEPSGTISIMGGPQNENSSLSATLSWVDYTTLGYLLLGTIFCLTANEIIPNAFRNLPSSIYNGATTGVVALIIVVCFALVLRYVVKYYYNLGIGLGVSAYIYYTFLSIVVITSTGIWLWATVAAYRDMCMEEYSYWVISLIISIIVSLTFVTIQALIYWLVQSICPRSSEQFVLPDEVSTSSDHQSKSNKSAYKQFPVKQLAPGSLQPPQHQAWHGIGPMQVPLINSPFNQYPNTGHAYPSPNNTMINAMPSYKTLQTNYDPHPMMAMQPQALHPIQIQTQPQQQTYNQQTTLGGGKVAKKIGSSESTGSTYYQQLMKNKGGVKSISQYGELMRQKKTAKANTAKQ